MHRLTLAALALLTACVAPAKAPPAGAFRDTSRPIYSSAVFDPSRLAGKWRQVAAFGPDAPGCAPGGVDITGRSAPRAAFRLCLGGQDYKGSGALAVTGPGRLTIAGQDWWVIWADADYRTLAIGTPSGAFGFVLNRGGPISADRLTAAREIFEWNGYDLAGFRRF